MNNDLNMKENSFLNKNNNGKEINKNLELQILIENGQINDINIFLKKNSLSPQILNEAIIILLHNYKNDNYNFYEILRLLLLNGASPNLSIVYQDKKNNIRQEEKVTLLMFGIIKNDINLINLVLNFKPDIEQKDCFERNAIIYAILYDNNDSTNIMKLLIKNNANINYSYNLQKNTVQYHSVLTLACCRNLVKIVKCLLDNNVDTNFRTKPEGDTCLHLAVKYGLSDLVELLLFHAQINPEIINNNGKKPVDLIKPDENGQLITKIFSNYYNKHNMIDNNQKYLEVENYKRENLNINNSNKEYYKELHNDEDNNKISQINQFNHQIKQMNFNMNDGNIYSSNMKINFFPPDKNNSLVNNIIKDNNIYNYNKNNLGLNNSNSNRKINTDINDSCLEENVEYEKENIEEVNQRQNILKKENFQIKYNINRQIKKNKYINRDINQNIHQINPYKINLLKKNLYNGLFSNKRFKYNMEIPVGFNLQKKKNSNNLKCMNNFIFQNNTPILNLDLTNNNLINSELKIIELKQQLKKYNINFELEKKIEQLNEQKRKEEKILEEKNKTQRDLDNQIIILEKKVKELKEKKKKLSEIVIHYTNLKFDAPTPSDIYIYKTLEKDLNDYEKYINYKIEGIHPRIEIIINKIKIIVEEIIPEYELKLYGSYSHGLNLPESDLNLILINKNENIIINNYINDNIKEDNITDIETTVGEKSLLSGNQNEKDEISEKNINELKNKKENDILSKLYNFFQNCDWILRLRKNQIDNINFIDFITDENLGSIKVNISLENENHNGLKIVKLTKKFMKEYSFLRPLYLALGTVLRKAKLNIQAIGGLSSYGLLLMIICFIQKEKIIFKSKEKEYILGKAFYEFLSYYGIKFDLNRYVEINYEMDDKKEKNKTFNLGPIPQELTIIDPFNNKNNIAKLTYQYINIKMAFIIAKMVTQEVCECGCHFFRADHINKNNSIEHSYLKRMFNSVKRFLQ